MPFSADPGHIFTFSTAPVIGNRIVVYTLGTGSCIEFYANSHKKDLRGVRASNGLLEIAEASLRKNGCNTIPVQMEKGGMYVLSGLYYSPIRYLIHSQCNTTSQARLPNQRRIHEHVWTGNTETSGSQRLTSVDRKRFCSSKWEDLLVLNSQPGWSAIDDLHKPGITVSVGSSTRAGSLAEISS